MKNVKLLPLFLNEGFRSVAVSFVGFFSGIFIYKSVLPILHSPRLAIATVIVFYLGLYFFKAVGCSLAQILAQKFGLKRQMLISQLLFLLFLALISMTIGKIVFIFISSFLWGLSAGFYWFGWHSLMAKECDNHKFGREIGVAGSLTSILLAGAPFAGGLIIYKFGYIGMFVASFISVVVSAFFLPWVKDEKIHHDTSLRDVFRLFTTHKKVFLTYFGHTVAGVIYADLFPLYLFLIIGKELELGEFFTVAILFGAVLNIIVGRLIDLKGNKGFLKFGAVTLSLVWVGRFLTKSASELLILDVITRFTSCTIGIPLNVLSYKKAIDGHSTGKAILFQELAIGVGEIFACILLLTLVLVGVELKFAFLWAAAFILMPLLIS